MKRCLLLPLTLSGLIFTAGRSLAQHPGQAGQDSVTRLLRVYEDNDGINLYGQPTDDAYTNGTRIDLYYIPQQRPQGLLGRFGLRAGSASSDVYSWGIMQLMYTPMDYTQTGFQSNDYPYSGAIVATHGRYSYNAAEKYDLQTELTFGALGPVSLAHQTQSIVHRITGFLQPMGWNTQYRNAPLLNLTLTGEKQLAAAGEIFQVIGGGRVFAGTMQNGASLYPLILFGKMNPYFGGPFSQYTTSRRAGGRKRWQVWFFAKPELQYFFSNALLEGGMFTRDQNVLKPGDQQPAPGAVSAPAEASATTVAPAPAVVSSPALQHWVGNLSFGSVLTHGHFSISVAQNVGSATMKGLYCHDVGNISLYFGW
jgi:hypothetical protein